MAAQSVDTGRVRVAADFLAPPFALVHVLAGDVRRCVPVPENHRLVAVYAGGTRLAVYLPVIRTEQQTGVANPPINSYLPTHVHGSYAYNQVSMHCAHLNCMGNAGNATEHRKPTGDALTSCESILHVQSHVPLNSV